MAQLKENYSHSGDFMVYIPKNSTAITSGDIVVMPRKSDPRSRATLGALGRISPISSASFAPWSVGIADADFTSTTVGSTLYAAPTSNQAIPVYKRGVFKLAIVETSGNAGDLVKYSSGATGAQLFTTKNVRVSEAIGILEKTFSGATANDCQYVKLIEKDEVGLDIAFFLDNRVLNDGLLKPISGTSQSFVNVGTTYTGNRQGTVIVLKGKYFRITRDTNLAVAKLTGGAASAWKARMIVARSGSFAYRTCSGTKTTLATFTKTGFSAAYFTPTTQTSGEIAIGYVVFGSAVTKASAGMLFQLRGISRLPLGYCHWAL
jgi:hypothetical protein